MHPILRYLLLAFVPCALLFLGLSGFFAAWDGVAVSRRPSVGEDPAFATVLLVTSDGGATEVTWPARLADELKLPIERTGTPPNDVPDTAPHASKRRFTLFFLVDAPGGTRSVPTTGPGAVAATAVALVLGFLLNNMRLSGSPFSWRARAFDLPASQPRTYEVAGEGARPPPPAARSRFGPPPPRQRRGGGRRR